MALSDKIPDYEERKEFLTRFVMATAKAMHDLRLVAAGMTLDQIADELEARNRPEVGDYYLGRPELLVLAKDVKG